MRKFITNNVFFAALLLTFAALLLTFTISHLKVRSRIESKVRSGTESITLPSGRKISPWGKHVVVGRRPTDFAVSPSGKLILVLNSWEPSVNLVDIDGKEETITSVTKGISLIPKTVVWKLGGKVDFPYGFFQGVTFSPYKDLAFFSLGPANKICVGQVREKSFIPCSLIDDAGEFPTGICLNKKGDTLYTANYLGNSVSIIDLRKKGKNKSWKEKIKFWRKKEKISLLSP